MMPANMIGYSAHRNFTPVPIGCRLESDDPEQVLGAQPTIESGFERPSLVATVTVTRAVVPSIWLVADTVYFLEVA